MTHPDPETLDALIGAGMNVARLNFSHGSHEQHRAVEQCVGNHRRPDSPEQRHRDAEGHAHTGQIPLREIMILPLRIDDGQGRGQHGGNLVVIGDPDDVYYAFIRAGWDETEVVSRASGWKTVKSFLSGGEYRYSPVSSLYVFGRPQDVAFQWIRENIHERNHLRLWYSPLRYQGQPVFFGQVSRDIGVRFTSEAWPPVTHKIDPDIDEARHALVEADRQPRLGVDVAADVDAARREAALPRVLALGVLRAVGCTSVADSAWEEPDDTTAAAPSENAEARYAEVMRGRREMAEAAGLNPDVIESMYRLLVDNFINEEMELLQIED